MVDAEKMADMLVGSAEILKRKHNLDMSMFPKEMLPEIYQRAADKALLKGGYEDARFFLKEGKQWDRLLGLGREFFHSGDKKEMGKDFLLTVNWHHELPKGLAVELADHIMEDDPEHSFYIISNMLKKANAKSKAREIGYELLKKGDFKNSQLLLDAAGIKLSKKEAEKYAMVAIEKERYKDAFQIYKSASLEIPRETALALVEGAGSSDTWFLEEIMEYAEKKGGSFTLEDIARFGDTFFFEEKHYYKSLELHKKAGNAVPPERYKFLGEELLKNKPDEYYAFQYLSIYDEKEAKKRLVEFSDNVIDKLSGKVSSKGFKRFENICDLVGEEMPAEKILTVARIAEGHPWYSWAAKFYVLGRKPEEAKRLGTLAFQKALECEKDDERDDWFINARICFGEAGDEEGRMMSNFITRNYDRY